MVPIKVEVRKDRGSWEVGTSHLECGKNKKSDLSEKIANSKRKSLEVLMRLKGLKSKS